MLRLAHLLLPATCCFRYLSDRARSISLRYGITVQTNERLRNWGAKLVSHPFCSKKDNHSSLEELTVRKFMVLACVFGLFARSAMAAETENYPKAEFSAAISIRVWKAASMQWL